MYLISQNKNIIFKIKNMNELQQKQLDFLEDTVKYYSEDISRRAVNNYSCRYRTNDGRKCAISYGKTNSYTVI